MARKHEEEDSQKIIVAYCRKLHIPILGSASGIYVSDIRTAMRFKALAIIADKGQPDLFIPVVKKDENGNVLFSGLMIELKKKGGKATKEQLEWINYYNKNGYYARVIEGHDNAIELINNYINGSL